jgi:hypothetical protein
MWRIALATTLAQSAVTLVFFGWAASRLKIALLHLLRRLLPMMGGATLSFATMFMASHHSRLQKLPPFASLAFSLLAGCAVYAGFVWLVDSSTVQELKQLAFERKASVASPAHSCPNCGYSLPGSMQTCPECGHQPNQVL